VKRRLLDTLSLLRQAVVKFFEDDGLDLSAAVAFYSLVSLGPALYLMASILSRVFQDTRAGQAAVESLMPFFPVEVADRLREFALALRASEGLVLVALPALLWVSSTAFSALQRSISTAFGRPPSRTIWRSRLKSFAVLGSGLLFLSIIIVANTLLPRLGQFREALGLPATPTFLGAIRSHLVLPLISFLIIVLFYKILPRGGVSWKAAAGGAALAIVLWETARQMFGWALARSQSYGVLTGALAGIVGFLLWIQTAVAILLLGAELGGLLDRNRDVSD